ncbi:hypothetical protein HXX76_014388 [Chlamydomonas incerta]|uniref:ER membrane protein complex subunit 1 n=1 Tax=Chlamydomonas incerta TaxID=51695 RepID=A0A835SC03_CHLIN|nr:hypothetical protein HXX76_014388 [Chlamydomonas incerta]|eukprot:KAG2424507.1 hypothetical protein HXX76_014388 [Chlamydomonas incerta]
MHVQIFLAIAVFALVAAARFEDQAGAYDWYKQHIGIVSSAQFHPSKPRVCVTTEQSVVACLNLRDGSIAWRKPLQALGAAPSVAYVESLNSLVTASGGYLHAFDLEGGLKWQRKLPTQTAALVAEVQGKATEKVSGAILAVQAGAVQVLDAADASQLSKPHQLKGLAKDNVVTANGYLVAYNTGSKSVLLASAASFVAGDAAAEVAVEAPLGLSASAAGGPAGFAAISDDGSSLCVLQLGGTGDAAFSCQRLDALVPDLSATSPLGRKLIATSAGFVLVGGDAGAAVLAAGDGQLKLLRFFAAATAASAEATVGDDAAVGLVEGPSGDKLRLLVVSVSSGEVLQEEDFPAAALRRAAHGAPLQPSLVALGAFRKKDKSWGVRALVVFRCGLTALLQQGVVVWSRDESLATIGQTLFVDLPANGTALKGDAGAKADINTRIRYQVLGAKVQLKLNTPAEAAELLELRGLLSDKNTPTRDVNGFRKLLLALTGTGALTALHNGDGRVLWSRTFPPDAVPMRLLQWRSYHDITHAPEVLLLREAHPGAYVAAINAHTGEELWKQPLPHGVSRVVPVPAPLIEGSAVQSVYLLVDHTPAPGAVPVVTLLPDTQASQAHFASSQRSPYLFWEGSQPGTLQGFSLEAGAAGAGIAARLAWQVALPDSVLALATRDPTEPIQSSVKVLSDRTIKYKYLNPNLLFVATGLANGAALDGDDSTAVTAHLVDTVTGRVLYSQSHAGARGPVTAVVSENLVLYHFRDVESGRFVACAMELYDATPGREFSVLDYLFNPNSTQPVSSLTPTPIEAVSQSYFSRIVPTGLAVTRTEQGITAKQLLVITNTDQVYALDRRWVDPRRPKKQKLTQDEMEEGLTPYQDTLPFSPLSFATLDKQVLGLRGVAVEPTRLESTCLMFVHGVDLFYTRLAPAKGFDSLEDDFNYALLIAALVALSVGAVVMNYMTKQAQLAWKWK